MATPRKDPKDIKRVAGPKEGKGYWEPDFELEAALHAIEIEELTNMTGRPKFWTEERAYMVGKDMCEWARQEDAITTAGYLANRGLHRQHANMLSSCYPRFRTLYTIAKQMVGRNRERAAGKKFDSGMAKKYAACYDSDYKNWELQIRDLDAKANSKEINVNVRGKMEEPVLEEDKSAKFQAVKRKLKDKSDELGDE